MAVREPRDLVGNDHLADSSIRLVRNPTIVHERFGAEAVLVHLGLGRYYSLNPSGAEIWELLATAPTEAELLANAPGPEARAAARAFLEQLTAEDLVRKAPEAGAAGPTADRLPTRWTDSPPVMEVFTDLEDLLILDPIHDIGDAGWPSRGEPRDES